MAESVGALHVELTGTSAKLTTELDKGKAAVRGFSGAMRQGMAAGRTATTGQGNEIAKLGRTLQGARPALSGALAGVMALGEKGSPAVRSLGRAIFTLASTGFTPLGIALGLAVAGMALFASGATKTTEVTKEARNELASMREELAKLELQLRAKGARPPRTVQEQQSVEDIELTRLRVASLRKHVAEDIAAIEELGLAHAEQQRMQLDERLRQDRALLKVYADQLSLLEQQERVKRQIAGPQPRTLPGLEQPALLKAIGGMRTLTKDELDKIMRPQREARERLDRYLDELEEGFREDATQRLARLPWDDSLTGIARGVPAPTPKPPESREGEWRAIQDFLRERQNFSEGFAEQMQAMRDEMLDAGRLGATVADTIGTGFSNAFASIVTGSASASQAIRRFGAMVLETASRIAAEQAASWLIGAAISAAGGLFGAGPVNALGQAAPAGTNIHNDPAAQGIGRLKSMPIVETKSAQIAVVVHNYSSTARMVSHQMEDGPRGPELHQVIEDVVARSARDGGKVADTLERSYGLHRRGRRN